MTPEEFIAFLPEFKNVPAADIQLRLDHAVPHFNVTRWGAFYPEGVANFVAHDLVTSPPPGFIPAANDGAMTVKQVGSVRVERAAAVVEKQVDDPWLRTKYGQRYRFLAKRVGWGPVVVPG